MTHRDMARQLIRSAKPGNALSRGQPPDASQASQASGVFADLVATTCNLSPSSAEIYKDAIEVLRSHKEIEVISGSTGKPTY